VYTRVNALIDDLGDRTNDQGVNVLILFLNVLAGCVPPEDSLRQDIQTLTDELSIALASDASHRTRPSAPPATLAQRIDKEALWQYLQRAAIQAVIAGGSAVMTYYGGMNVREALAGQEALNNPSTEADLVATTTIVQTINLYLHPLTINSSLNNPYLYYLGEETRFEDERAAFQERLLRSLPDVRDAIKPPNEFFASPRPGTIRVIFDALDGTVNYVLGIPLFCSGLAILIDDHPRIAAVYDPFHHVVYTGMLKGPTEDMSEAIPEARRFQVSSSDSVPLGRTAEKIRRRNRRKPVIGVHLTRSDEDKLREFVGVESGDNWSQLGRLARRFGGIYALNSGILAMTEVARGGLGGFVNNFTNLWDITPGEVIVRACGGKVTDFEGNLIDYSTQNYKTSVIAGYSEEIHKEICDALR
jgi:fructose-1,6-bisphosphatase/inositol monophosphatase family enzyme